MSDDVSDVTESYMINDDYDTSDCDNDKSFDKTSLPFNENDMDVHDDSSRRRDRDSDGCDGTPI